MSEASEEKVDGSVPETTTPDLWQTGYWGPSNPDEHPAVQALRGRFGADVLDAVNFRDEMTVRVSRERLLDVVQFLRDDANLLYNMLSDLTAVDQLRQRDDPRFDVVVQLYSIPNRQRLRVKCGVNDGETVPSMTALFAGANWMEREAYDMFGIIFDGHPELRRILLPDDWDEGHPLRKDYPLRGFREYVQPGFEGAAPRVRSRLRRR